MPSLLTIILQMAAKVTFARQLLQGLGICRQTRKHKAACAGGSSISHNSMGFSVTPAKIRRHTTPTHRLDLTEKASHSQAGGNR